MLFRSRLDAYRTHNEPREPEASFTPDLPSLDRDAHVVIFSSILLSGGTAKRCLSRVLLSQAKPVVLACLIDARRTPVEPIEKWVEAIPVVGLAHAEIIAEQDTSKRQRIRDINPITGALEDNVLDEEAENKGDYFITPDELYEMISAGNALHFNHVYRDVGRHFTFYLDAEKLIGNTRIMKAFSSTIHDWAEQTKKSREAGSKIDLMYPAPESQKISPARKLTHELWKQDRRAFNEPLRIHRNAAFGQFLFSKTDNIGDAVTIDIDWDRDVREDTYRSSGAGGQHVNKTDSAIRLTHLPTKVVVQCQSQRSQHKNRASARKMLAAKMYQIEKEKRDAELAAKRGRKSKIGFGGETVRNYVLHPEQYVKDARTGYKVGNPAPVLDGGLDPFIEEFLRWSIGKD